MKTGLVLALLLAIVFFPSSAWAWGFVTHIEVARTMLEQYRDILAMLGGFALDFPYSFAYGNVAPDRFLAKNLQPYPEHTHNWQRAFSMYHSSSNREMKAFSLGYLCHLASDVVAHNLFVPSKILEKRGFNERRHAYWELLFEQCQPEEAWDLAWEAERLAPLERLNEHMSVHQHPSLLSFKANVRLTERIFRVLRSSPARRLFDSWERHTPNGFVENEVRKYMDLSVRSSLEVIKEFEGASVVQFDPTGSSRIRKARTLSRVGMAMQDAPWESSAAARVAAGPTASASYRNNDLGQLPDGFDLEETGVELPALNPKAPEPVAFRPAFRRPGRIIARPDTPPGTGKKNG